MLPDRQTSVRHSIDLIGTDETAIIVSWDRGIVRVVADGYPPNGAVELHDRDDLDRLVGALVAARLEAFAEDEAIDWEDFDVDDGVDPWS